MELVGVEPKLRLGVKLNAGACVGFGAGGFAGLALNTINFYYCCTEYKEEDKKYVC